MRSLLQPGLIHVQRPLWLRWLAVLSIALMAVMTTAQACHTHDAQPQVTSSRHHAPAQSPTPNQGPNQGPEHCPLCVAMHSTMPASLQTAPEPVLHIQALDSSAADAERLFRWRFQLASRPPPADLPGV